MVPAANGDTTTRKDVLVLAVWFGLLTGFVEGAIFLRMQHLRVPEMLWMPAAVDVVLALFLALPIMALRNALAGRPALILRVACLYSWLMIFDWMRVSHPNVSATVALMIALLLALAITVSFRLPFVARFPRRSLPWLAVMAAGCVIGVTVGQHIRESRQIAGLPASRPGSPNVLVVVIDTLRADHLSTYGYGRPTSPSLTRLAQGGVLFENAVAPSSWTLPSHASMLTGLYPHEHGAQQLSSAMDRRYPTLGEFFQHLGYRTAAFSGSTYFFCRRTGLARGFIHFEDDFESAASALPQSYWGERVEKLLYRVQLRRNRLGRRSAREINEHALRWIDSGHQPFLAFLNYYDTHDPYLPPEPYLHRYSRLPNPGGRIALAWDWFVGLTPEERQGQMDAYDGAIEYVDAELGNLLRELAKRGLDKNTLVVITSDHGESFNEHGTMGHLSGLYRELIHVPLVLWQPAKMPAGIRIDASVSIASVPATLASLVDGGIPGPFPGDLLQSAWTNGQFAPAVSELAQMKLTPLFPNYYGALTSVTTNEWHYIAGGKAGEELFRCCGAGRETENVANTAQGKRICESFKKQLELVTEPRLASVPRN